MAITYTPRGIRPKPGGAPTAGLSRLASRDHLHRSAARRTRPARCGPGTGEAGARGARGQVDRSLARGGHVRVRAAGQPGRGVQHRHPAAHGVGLAARGPRVLLHPHRPGRPLPADDRQARLLPDRLGRQRPADRAPGAELLRRALRPDRAVRLGLHPAGEAGPEEPAADQPAQLRGAVPRADPRRREGVRGPVAAGRAERGLVHALHDHLRRLDRGGPARVPAQRASATRRTSPRPRRCGT